MGIRILPPEVAVQIAAGEVVERPASVVKELVENSIDAGARDIRIEVEEGGRRLVRVADDGCGIPSAEVEVAFHRHSTSKLSNAQDLDRIRTLGFRGEALASIAAVSRTTLVTRATDEETGVLLRLEGGEIATMQPTGRPLGTTVTVEDLFYNVPARRKFLRTETTERRRIDAWITRYAMAYPQLRFILFHGGRETFRSPGNGVLRDVLAEVYGLETGAALLEIPEDPGGDPAINVRGLVSPSSLHRANRSRITLFVNGRWVQDSRLTYAVIQAYHTLLPTGRYPIAVVMATVPPQDVDVNIHPAKVEVRFRDENIVFRAMQRAVRRAVTGQSPIPEALSSRAAWPGFRAADTRHAWTAQAVEQEQVIQPPLVPQGPSPEMPVMRVIGQVGAAYIVAEGPDGLYLIDQHAAHERVLYERAMAQREEGMPSQRLLEPTAAELPLEAVGTVEAHLELMSHLGFELEFFGGSTFLVRALPAMLAQVSPAHVLLEVADALEEGRSRVAEEVEQAVMRRVCKQAAVKAGQVLTREEMEGLVQSLEGCASPRTCPHGRPTMIHISTARLAHEFGRE